MAQQSGFAPTGSKPDPFPFVNRTETYAHFGHTDAQARLADLMRDLYISASGDGRPGERYNEILSTEAQARMAHALLNIALRGAGVTVPPFPGDRPPKVRPRHKGRRDSIFERVKSAVRIEELAGRFTELANAGVDKLRGLCPVHDEKTASFHVDLQRQTWHCFGACARGGDVIALAQELMNRGRL